MSIFPFKKGWIFTDIKGIREHEESATYYYFDYDTLPPVEIELDAQWKWLEAFPEQLEAETSLLCGFF